MVFNSRVGLRHGPNFGSNCQNTTWFVLTLPFMEGTNLFNAVNFDVGSEGWMILTGYPYSYAVNSTAMTSRIGFFQCPSDTEKPFDIRSSTVGAVLSGVPALLISKGNYGVNWGNTDYGQGQRGDSWFTSNPSAHRAGAVRLQSGRHRTTDCVDLLGDRRHEQHAQIGPFQL